MSRAEGRCSRTAEEVGPALGDREHAAAAGVSANEIDVGALKGNRGDQQYELPRHAALAGRTVVTWCRAFSAPFGSAPLRAV
jgi:hypothetical protein